MSGPVVVALDADTSLVRARAFDAAGELVAHASRPNVIWSARGIVEQDMARTWEDACAVLGELAAHLDGTRVAALSITGQGDGTWLVDREGIPVAPAILWLDARAAELVEDLRQNGAARAAFLFTGTGLAACQQPAQLLWLDRNRPEVLQRAATAFHCTDWLYLTLTGVAATDPSEASFSFGDYRTRSYREEVLDALNLAHLRRFLPPIVDELPGTARCLRRGERDGSGNDGSHGRAVSGHGRMLGVLDRAGSRRGGAARPHARARLRALVSAIPGWIRSHAEAVAQDACMSGNDSWCLKSKR